MHLPLPKFKEAKRAIINPQNQDNECFKWPVLAALHNPEIKYNPERISKLRKFELCTIGQIYPFQHC